MDGLRPWCQIMVHAILPKHSTSVMKVFSVNHITSSLHYPQSNGLAEKYVQIVKCLFNKAKEECTDLYKCLMIYHNTPSWVTCSCLCRFCMVEVLDLTCQCPILLGNCLVSSLKWLGTLRSIKQFVDSLKQNICCNKTSFHPMNSWTSSGLRENLLSAPCICSGKV